MYGMAADWTALTLFPDDPHLEASISIDAMLAGVVLDWDAIADCQRVLDRDTSASPADRCAAMGQIARLMASPRCVTPTR